MDIHKLYVSQRKLRNPGQVRALVEAIRQGDPVPPILVSEDEDGTQQVEDGHHRLVAHRLAGKAVLALQDYVLVPRERRRPRFGRVEDLIRRIGEGSLR